MMSRKTHWREVPKKEEATKLEYGLKYWQETLGDEAKSRSFTSKTHLVFSLMMFLGLSIANFLEFFFISHIPDVHLWAGKFMGFYPAQSQSFAPAEIYQLWHENFVAAWPHLHSMIEECALEMAKEESDQIISDKSFQIQVKDLTISSMRALFQPQELIRRYKAAAPFMWNLLMVFVASPNRYRKEKEATSGKIP